jgi:hypothetical protein
MLAQIAEKRGLPEQATAHLEEAAATAKSGRVQWLLAETESDLADSYSARGDMKQALGYAEAAVVETAAAGAVDSRCRRGYECSPRSTPLKDEPSMRFGSTIRMVVTSRCCR